MTSVAAIQPLVARRAHYVSWGERVSNALLGNTQIHRAYGRYQFRESRKSGSRIAKQERIPVFEVDRCGFAAGEQLPKIWVTEPVVDESTWQPVGRQYVGAYPMGQDRGGWKALELANRYIGEARSYDSEAMHKAVIQCYRAAEILLLHAAEKSNAEALVKLAYIYENDCCEGKYWQGLLELGALHAKDINLTERVLTCLNQAMQLGSADATYKLATMMLGSCEEAIQTKGVALLKLAYDRSIEASQNNELTCANRIDLILQAGESALKVAQCCEFGHGCCHSFETARIWYKIAEHALQAVLEHGSWSCKKSLSIAKKGALRMSQEIAGCY